MIQFKTRLNYKSAQSHYTVIYTSSLAQNQRKIGSSLSLNRDQYSSTMTTLLSDQLEKDTVSKYQRIAARRQNEEVRQHGGLIFQS